MRARSLLAVAVSSSLSSHVLVASESSMSFSNTAATSSSLSNKENQESSTTCEYGYPLYRLRVLFVRHGESQNNVLYGKSPQLYRQERLVDPDLTERGLQQAAACGLYLSAHESFSDFNPIMGNVDALYVSPMLRTLRTAEPIAQSLSLRPEVWTDIYEISGLHMNGQGQAGLTKSQIQQEFPNYVVPSTVTESGWYPVERNKETRSMAKQRVLRVANRLFDMAAADCRDQRTSKTIALVCHGDFKDMVLQALLGLDIPLPKKRRFLSYNTAVTVVDIDVANNDERHATVLLQNFVGHLNSTLITHEALGIV